MTKAACLALILLLGCASNPRYTSEKLPAGKAMLSTKSGKINKVKMGQVIESYLDIPYKENGENRTGVDCSGLVVAVYREYAKIRLPHDTKKLFQLVKQVDKDDLQFGDLVFFSDIGWMVSHVGIYIGNGRFVHSGKNQGVIISFLQDEYYGRRYLGARRVIP